MNRLIHGVSLGVLSFFFFFFFSQIQGVVGIHQEINGEHYRQQHSCGVNSSYPGLTLMFFWGKWLRLRLALGTELEISGRGNYRDVKEVS
jgi:hypothetical protein